MQGDALAAAAAAAIDSGAVKEEQMDVDVTTQDGVPSSESFHDASDSDLERTLSMKKAGESQDDLKVGELASKACAQEDAAAPEAAEVPKVADALEVEDISKDVDPLEAAEVYIDANTPEVAEASKVSDAPNVIEVSKVIAGPEDSEISSDPNAPKVAKVSEVLNAPEVSIDPNAPEVAEVSKAAGAPEVAEVSKDAGALEVAEVPTGTCAPEVAEGSQDAGIDNSKSEESREAPIASTEGGSIVDEPVKECTNEQTTAPLEEKSIEVNSSTVPTVGKENGIDEKVVAKEESPVKELNGNNKSKSATLPIGSKETVASKVDEQRILQEMRAKVAELDPLSKDTEEATLRRFLRARSWKLSKAVKMFIDHQKWRHSFVPLGHVPKEEIKNELEAEKVFMQGHDMKGRPIALILAAKHDANKRKFDEFKRYLVFNFDTLVASLKPGEETFTVILDLKGLAFKNLDARGWISTFDFLQAYYPERLGRLFIIHVPKLFWGAWKLVYPFIDKVTREKIDFVEDKFLEQKLQEEINKEQIPDGYGGTLPLVPIQNVVVPNWPPKQADT